MVRNILSRHVWQGVMLLSLMVEPVKVLNRRERYDLLKTNLARGAITETIFNDSTRRHADLIIMDQLGIPVDQQNIVMCSQCNSKKVQMHPTGIGSCTSCGREFSWSPPPRNSDEEGFKPEICPNCYSRDLTYEANGTVSCPDCQQTFTLYAGARFVKGKPFWDPFFSDPFSCIHCNARGLVFNPVGKGKCRNCKAAFTWESIKRRNTTLPLPAHGTCVHCSSPRVRFVLDGWARCGSCGRWFWWDSPPALPPVSLLKVMWEEIPREIPEAEEPEMSSAQIKDALFSDFPNKGEKISKAGGITVKDDIKERILKPEDEDIPESEIVGLFSLDIDDGEEEETE